MMKKNAKVVSTFAFLLAIGLADSLRASEFAWTGGGMDAFWNNPANWSSDGGSPRATGGDSLVFGNEGTNRPGRLDQDYQIVDLDVENLASEHVLDLNSQKLIYTGTLRIGYAVTNCALRITNGTFQVGTESDPADIFAGYVSATSATYGFGCLTLEGLLDNRGLHSLYIGHAVTDTARQAIGHLDLSQASIVDATGASALNLRGGLYVGQRGLRSQGTLLLPPSLESLRIGGSLQAGNGSPSSSEVLARIDFGENSALTNWSVGGNFTIGCGYHAVVTNLPENVTFQVGSRENPSSMLIAHGGRYHGVCELTLNHGVFDAFLEELKIGGHYSSSATESKGTLGSLDLGTSVVQFNGMTNGVHLPRLWLSRSRNHRPGILRLPSSVTNITIGECVIGASRDYGELDLGDHSELQTFTVTNGFYLAADIDGLNPANSQTCNDGRIVGWPTNVDVTIGQPEAPCPLFIGITRQYGTGAANRMILTNGSFTAWVSDLALGIEKRDGYGSGITGVLDLRETELRQLDISGHAFVGCWTNEVVGYQNNYRGHGELRLPAGDVRVGGDLRVGDAHSTSSGLVEMLGSRMSVGGVAEINATGLIEVRLDGASAGLNLLNPAENVLTIADGGELQLRFENAPAVLEDHFWGLRMIGDRQQQLTEMAADGRLTWINNLEDTERVLGIHYDVSRDLTIVGLHRPVGTMILLR